MEFAASLLTDHPTAPIFIAFAIGLPSLVIYIAEVAVMLSSQTRKRFDSAFYRLFLSRAAVNILGYFVSYANVRFGRLGFLYSFYMNAGSFFIAVNWFLN